MKLHINSDSLSLLSLENSFDTPEIQVNTKFSDYLLTQPKGEYYNRLYTFASNSRYSDLSIESLLNIVASDETLKITQEDIFEFITFCKEHSYTRSSLTSFLLTTDELDRFVRSMKNERELSKKHEIYFSREGEAATKISTIDHNLFHTYTNIKIISGTDIVNGCYGYSSYTTPRKDFVEFKVLKKLDKVVGEFKKLKNEYYEFCKKTVIKNPGVSQYDRGYRNVLHSIFEKEKIRTSTSTRSWSLSTLDSILISSRDLQNWEEKIIKRPENSSEEIFKYISTNAMESITKFVNTYDINSFDINKIHFSTTLTSTTLTKVYEDYKVFVNESMKKMIPYIILYNYVKENYVEQFEKEVKSILKTSELQELSNYKEVLDLLFKSIPVYLQYKEKQQKTV